MAVYPVLNGWKTFFIPLSFILSDVPVFDDGKTLYQKALRVVVTRVTFLRRQVVTSDLSVTLLERMMCCRQ